MRVLLTGATGFIGAHVARELLRRGHEVHATVRPSSDRRRLREIERDLRLHEGEMDRVPVEPELLIHLAWYAVPGKYLEAPENEECLEKSRRLLSRVGCRAVVAGTCFEYDLSLGTLREDSPLRPGTRYARSKAALRRDVEARPDSAWVRFFYQYGPWEDERRLVPAVARALLRDQPARVTPGDERRAYLHVEDVAAGVCDVAESRLTGPVNVGSDAPVPVREIVSRLAAFAGRPDLVRWGAYPFPAGEPALVAADNQRLRSTGWFPRIPLEEGLGRTFEWWRESLERSGPPAGA